MTNSIQIKDSTIDSREVAEMVGKTHNKLMRDIRTYINQLGESKIGHTVFFTESEYTTEQNKSAPCYLVTKKGCEFIAHKLTGRKGTEFTAKYINRFHEMEQQIASEFPIPKSPMDWIKMQNAALIEVDEKVDRVSKQLEDFKGEMPLLGVDIDEVRRARNQVAVQLLGGKDAPAYKDRSLTHKVYSDMSAQLTREFGVSNYKAIHRNQVKKAVEITKAYKLPMALADAISDANENEQLSF